jgi:hypothetical protein
LALTVQRKLELAGDLAKVQPLLQRLHLVEKPKKRFGGRYVVFVSSVIGAVALVLAAVAVRRRWRRLAVAVADVSADPRADDSSTENALLPEDALPVEDALPTSG